MSIFVLIIQFGSSQPLSLKEQNLWNESALWEVDAYKLAITVHRLWEAHAYKPALIVNVLHNTQNSKPS